MSTQHNALKLADQLSDMCRTFGTPSHNRGITNGAIQTIRTQHALIVQMRESISKHKASEFNSDHPALHAAITAADDYLKGRQ